MRRFEPMTLANMRQNGVRMVTATCAHCGRSADVNVDLLPETLTVPGTGKRLRCSSCGGKTISTRPAWHSASRPGTPDLSARTAAGVIGRRLELHNCLHTAPPSPHWERTIPAAA
jgi:hypothetical protein